MGAESRYHAQLLIQKDSVEKKSEAGLSVTATVWQGPRDRGLIGSHGGEALMSLCWKGRLCEAETLKKERKKCGTYKASVSGWTVNHPEAWKAGQAFPVQVLQACWLETVVKIYRGSRTHDLGYKFFSAYMRFPGSADQSAYQLSEAEKSWSSLPLSLQGGDQPYSPVGRSQDWDLEIQVQL